MGDTLGLPLHVTLTYYKRQDIRQSMAQQCRGKEVAVKYADRFGKRPDIVLYDADLLSFAQKKATSFHISEETWSNPMQLSTGLRQSELNDLRMGWDLVLDVDFPLWKATLEISQALVEQLVAEGVPREAITAKFSGNKGFHIAVPFEAFPDTIVLDDGTELETSDLFPDGVRSVVEYLVHRIDGPDNSYALSERLVRTLPDLPKDLLVEVCERCSVKAPAKDVSQNEFVCPNCDYRIRSDDDYITCPSPGCGALLNPVSRGNARRCVCGSERFRKKVDLAIDTMLVTSRHMYRMVYSLHEKSGLASIPVDPFTIKDFDKDAAQPHIVQVALPFLDRDVERGSALTLLQRGLAFQSPGKEEKKEWAEVEWTGDAAPEEFFPPPIKKMLAGLKDGRKRALFVLVNFLRAVGWSYEMIDARLEEWNKRNVEVGGDGLRQTELVGHLRQHRQKEGRMPPNFDNDMYYLDLGVLEHDELSRNLKNPVTYVRKRMKQAGLSPKEPPK